MSTRWREKDPSGMTDMELIVAWVNRHAPNSAVPQAIATLCLLFTAESDISSELRSRLQAGQP
jgi:hypothetical protein